ncbi:MAG: mannose-1-phosphate guanylyltransferase, partial [Halobacteriaceae archaeon]
LLSAGLDTPLESMIEVLDEGDVNRAYDVAPSISIDYAVLERTDRAVVIPADFRWDDLGSWDAIGRVFSSPIGGEATQVDASNNVIASDGKHVSLIGIDDMVVAAYGDRILVVSRDDAQRVREIMQRK